MLNNEITILNILVLFSFFLAVFVSILSSFFERGAQLALFLQKIERELSLF
jgi:hypothetical protein